MAKKKKSDLQRKPQEYKAQQSVDINYTKYVIKAKEFALKSTPENIMSVLDPGHNNPARRRLDKVAKDHSLKSNSAMVAPEGVERLSRPIPPPRRGQELYGYSFESQVAASRLLDAEPVPFSFSDVKQLVKERLEYAVQSLQSWQNDPGVFGQVLYDALQNSKNCYTTNPGSRWIDARLSAIGIPSDHAQILAFEFQFLIYFATDALVLLQEIQCVIDDLEALGMPETGTALGRGQLSPDITDKYRDLIDLATKLVQGRATYSYFAWLRGIGREYHRYPADFSWERAHTARPTVYGPAMLEIDPVLWAIQRFLMAALESLGGFTKQSNVLLCLEQAMIDEPSWNTTVPRHLQQCLAETVQDYCMIQAIMRAYGPSGPSDAHKIRSRAYDMREMSDWPESLAYRRKLAVTLTTGIVVHFAHGPGGMQPKGLGEPGHDRTMLWLESIIKTKASGESDVVLVPRSDALDRLIRMVDAECGHTWDILFIPEEILYRPPRWDKKSTEPTPLVPFSTDGIAQSGHAYRSAEGIPHKFDETTSVESESRGHDEQSPSGKTPTDTSWTDSNTGTFRVSSNMYALAEKLFAPKAELGKGGQIRWTQIVTFMQNIGFSVDGIGGSMYRFTPPMGTGHSFVEHAPHPEPTMGDVRYRSFANRLGRLYGFDMNWFERAPVVMTA